MADPNDDFNDTRLGLLKSRLKLAKAFCKKPHEAWKKMIKEYEIEDVEDTEEIRDKVRIGYIFRRVESDIPAIFDDQPDIFLKGRGKYRAFDNFFDNTYDWLWDIQNLEERIEDAGVYFDLLGMAFVDSPWVTKTKKVIDTQPQESIDPATGIPQQVMVPTEYEVPIKDQPQAEPKDPFKVFFSPETKFAVLLDYDHCPYYLVEHSMTKEEIKARFGKDIETSEILHTNISDVDDEIDSLKDNKEDNERATVYEYYGCLPKKMTKGIKAQEDWSYDKDYHVWFTSNDELQAEECPYFVKPLLILGNYGLANKFWKFGDAKHLIHLVQELEQYRTQLLRHTRKMANPKPLIPDDADVDADAFRDPNVGRIVTYKPSATGAKPEYLSPAQLGGEVGVGIQMVRTDLEQTSGTFQLAQGSGQSQVKTPRGIATFSEAADRNVRRKRKKIARFIKALICFQFRQCAMNFAPDDTRVVDIISGGEETQVPIQEVLALMGDDNILAKVDVEVESLSINRVQMKQDALDLFDVASQHPDVFNLIEIAKDLLQNGFNKKDADRYLVSMDQLKMQGVQELMANLGQTNPELAGALAQQIQNPNMASMQQGQMPGANPVKPSQPQQPNGMPPLPQQG